RTAHGAGRGDTADPALCAAGHSRQLRSRRHRRRPALPGGRPSRRLRGTLMDTSELAPLEAAIAKLTARAPDKLYVIDARRRERLEAELERQLAPLEDEDAWGDADIYLHEHVLDQDGGDDIVVTDAYPRNAGIASGIYQALKALRLPSGATIYYETGEWDPQGIRAASAHAMDDEAAARFGDVIALPTYFHAGDDLLEIDEHLSACTPGSWMFDELVDSEADWIPQERLDEGEARRAELQRAIDESLEEGDSDPEQIQRAQEALEAAPPWFLRLTDEELEQIAHYPLPDPGRKPRP